MSARRTVRKDAPASAWINQHGHVYKARTLKELRESIPGAVSIMYRDQKNGPPVRVGYVIGYHWLTEYAPVIRPA